MTAAQGSKMGNYSFRITYVFIFIFAFCRVRISSYMMNCSYRNPLIGCLFLVIILVCLSIKELFRQNCCFLGAVPSLVQFPSHEGIWGLGFKPKREDYQYQARVLVERKKARKEGRPIRIAPYQKTLNGRFIKEGENLPYYGFPEPWTDEVSRQRLPGFEIFHAEAHLMADMFDLNCSLAAVEESYAEDKDWNMCQLFCDNLLDESPSVEEDTPQEMTIAFLESELEEDAVIPEFSFIQYESVVPVAFESVLLPVESVVPQIEPVLIESVSDESLMNDKAEYELAIHLNNPFELKSNISNGSCSANECEEELEDSPPPELTLWVERSEERKAQPFLEETLTINLGTIEKPQEI